jgi:hypothetical protein
LHLEQICAKVQLGLGHPLEPLKLLQICPLHLQQTDPTQTENKARNSFTDRYGRPRFYYEGKEICNNFNGSKGSPGPFWY